jgi:hypothetical protein
MKTLFGAGREYVVIYSSDKDEQQTAHVRHRSFSRWVYENATDWRLFSHIPNRYPYKGDNNTGSLADFYIYEKGRLV